MFETGFPRDWSTLKKLVWLKLLQGAASIIKTVTGTAPITLTNAIAHAMVSLTQYGKCEQDGTPTPSDPVDIVCNNGALKYGKPQTIDPTRIKAYVNQNGLWVNSDDSYSVAVPVTVGKKYAIRMTDTTAETVGTILRYGFAARDTAGNSTTDPVQLTQWARSTPQDTPFVELTADNPFFVIQMGAGLFASNISNGYIVVTEQKVYADGTPEKIFVTGRNLFDKTKRTDNKLVNALTGALAATSAGSGRFASDYIPVKPNTLYSCNAIDDSSAQNGVAFYDVNKRFVSGIPYSNAMKSSKQFTVPNTASICYCRFSCYGYTDFGEVMLVEGETLGEYEAYFSGGTATAEDLFAVGDAADTQEIIGGAVTHNIGILVLDGTEDWQQGTYTFSLDNAIPDALYTSTAMCTHFTAVQNDTAPQSIPDNGMKVGASGYRRRIYVKCTSCGDGTAFKALLAAQYAAGTPVIVIYPLAEPTTESVTGQPLNTAAGTNTVSVVSNVDPVALTVEHKGISA